MEYLSNPLFALLFGLAAGWFGHKFYLYRKAESAGSGPAASGTVGSSGPKTQPK